MIIDSVKEFLSKECPLISGKKINVNYLGENQKYSIDTVPANPVIKKYTDGGSLRQQIFVFASQEYYDQETRENLMAAQFYEEFSDWMEGLDKVPELGVGLKAVRFEILSSGYLYKANTDKARYQLQFRLIYERGAH